MDFTLEELELEWAEPPTARLLRKKVFNGTYGTYGPLSWPELDEYEDSTQIPQPHRNIPWISRWTDPKAPLCRKCRRRKLDLRPLVAKPPDISEVCCEEIEEGCLEALETRFAVHIDKWSAEEATAKKSRCSLCALLSACLENTQQGGRLGYMQCTVTLRPRFDRSRLINKKGTIIHKHQIWVEFQPISGEVLLNLVDVKGSRRTEKDRALFQTADLKLLRWWLKNCDRRHSHPDTSTEALSRLQVIVDDGRFRLISTASGLVETLYSRPKFVVLSYVWGSASSQPRNQSLKGGPVADYAPTIRDAINTSRSLGYEWLWVDRLCIDQNSDIDKAKLIPYMRDIYAAADLTIVAACGNGAEDGLSGIKGTPRKPLRPLVIGSSFAVGPVSVPFPSLLKDTLWSKRGWTFQEYVYSKRLLFFLEREVFFSCPDHLVRESTGYRSVTENKGSVDRQVYYGGNSWAAQDLQILFNKKAPETEKILNAELFLRAVKEYSSRKLSVCSDRFVAFAGVILSAATTGDPISAEAFFKHGHPLSFFESLLTWTIVTSRPPVDKMPAPSWSWAYTGQEVDIWIPPTSSGNCYWYIYHQLRNYDIVAWPSKDNPMDTFIGLPLPDDMKPDLSWGKSISPTPKLHLFTLVFDARLETCDHGDKWHFRHKEKEMCMLMPFGTTETPRELFQNHNVECESRYGWSLRDGDEAYFLKPSKQYKTFALITGWLKWESYRSAFSQLEPEYELTLMLLEPTGEEDTYSRMGINSFREVSKSHYYADLIRQGNPRWQYIHLV